MEKFKLMPTIILNLFEQFELIFLKRTSPIEVRPLFVVGILSATYTATSYPCFS